MNEQLLKQILEELQGVKGEVAGIKGEVAETNQRLTNVESNLQILKETTSRIESKQQVIYEQTGHLSEYHTELKNGLEDIKDRLHFNTHKLTETELEIFKLKKN